MALGPSQDRSATAADEVELSEFQSSECQHLFVVCTHARDHLLVGAVTPASESMDDVPHRSRIVQRISFERLEGFAMHLSGAACGVVCASVRDQSIVRQNGQAD